VLDIEAGRHAPAEDCRGYCALEIAEHGPKLVPLVAVGSAIALMFVNSTPPTGSQTTNIGEYADLGCPWPAPEETQPAKGPKASQKNFVSYHPP